MIGRVARSSYAKLFEEVLGQGSLDDKKGAASTYEKIGRSIAAYQRSSEVNSFTSKYDYYLKGEADLTAQEANGLALFEGKAICSACHRSQFLPKLFQKTYERRGVKLEPGKH